MQRLEESLKALQQEFSQEINNAHTEEHVELLRVSYLGRKGSITAFRTELAALPLETKKLCGPLLNTLKDFISQKLDQKESFLKKQKIEQEEEKKKYFDVTAYKPYQLKGSLHPITPIIEHLENIFISMGFERVEGPEVEKASNNFDALNIPEDHPARDMYDTFWLDVPGMLMRTHTSNVQARVMQNNTPPLAVFTIGRCYRHEATDASHDVMFMQIEGLFIDKNVSLGNLCATIKTFVQALFPDTTLELRTRPGYFPFVEPGIEFDITCPFCTKGCSVCKRTGWLELGGSGLIHPAVLDYCGIDSKEYSGFAFGFGLTRLVMLLYGIRDIRLLSSGHIDFLKQF